MVVEGVWPEIDAGRFAIKRTPGEDVWVEADVFADGHDLVAAALRYRGDGQREWAEARMEPIGNDRFRGRFTVDRLGEYRYTIAGWVDRFATWTRDLRKKDEAGRDLSVDLLVGAQLVMAASRRASGADRERLKASAKTLSGDDDAEARAEAFDPELGRLMDRYPDRRHQGVFPRELRVTVDPPLARFSAWYELFPRSTGRVRGRHGTFDDVIARLPYVEKLGFDVLYLPPIHPVGHARRKGPNNTPSANPDDPGSPWAIGAREGGHTAVHPDLGTIADFERLVAEARRRGIEVALDIAFQTTPEHPWVLEHPEWFRHRPDGEIQHAENPPKVYEDIYPLDFETKDRRGLWEALRDVFRFWCDRGVRVFRVDNPHTKPFAFWEWVISEIKAERPDVVFLSEAFTRPKVMYRLAKLGFTQSYTYFAWRTTKWELTDYLTELTRTGAVEFFRPNFWPNTPDILTAYLQTGRRSAFAVRLILAATLSSSYGIYGPAFELMEHVPREPGSEEYRNSEKYEVRTWDLDRRDSLAPLITRVNRIRRANPALQSNASLRFHGVGNDELIAYSKSTPDRSNVILCIVNLDQASAQSGWTDLALDELGVAPGRPFEVEDLLTGATYGWTGPANFVRLDPGETPAHLLRVRGTA
ncbi:MAG TPA: alpha-1,4-glucan--maltose-1-phosphate maltosyltransferase [Actinomycetota bacterium]|nr:alpha-1,4-glucan--maltose-1-phosphate maltosyltransferase [Actinomycetota bacterium]